MAVNEISRREVTHAVSHEAARGPVTRMPQPAAHRLEAPEAPKKSVMSRLLGATIHTAIGGLKVAATGVSIATQGVKVAQEVYGIREAEPRKTAPEISIQHQAEVPEIARPKGGITFVVHISDETIKGSPELVAKAVSVAAGLSSSLNGIHAATAPGKPESAWSLGLKAMELAFSTAKLGANTLRGK